MKPKVSDAGEGNPKPKERQSPKPIPGAKADETPRDYFGSWAKDESGGLAQILTLPPAGDHHPPRGAEPTEVGFQALANEFWEGAVVDGEAGMASVGGTGLFDDAWLRV